MKFRLIFYKAKFDGHLLDDAIAQWTRMFNGVFVPLYSHVEVWWPDENGEFTYTHVNMKYRNPIGDTVYLGETYTSTMRGDNNGTVIRPASDILKHPERWDYMEFEVDDEIFNMAKANARYRAIQYRDRN